jgi:hypothetical protein
MKGTSREQYVAIFLTTAVLCFVFLSSGWLCPQPCQLPDSTEGIDDNSDWWSIIRANTDDAHLKPQDVETAACNFQIAGITVGKDELSAIVTKLGRAKEVSRGDASAGRSQICYESAEQKGSVHLVFESGEVQYAAYLFEGGPKWTGDDLCVKSPTVTHELKTASGLGPGMTRSQVESILGKPTASKGDKRVYFRQVKEKNSPEMLRRMKREHPEVSDEEFHRDYEFSDLTVYIEVKFSGSKVNYLGLSMSETM